MQLFSNESEEVTEEKESEVSKVKTAGMKAEDRVADTDCNATSIGIQIADIGLRVHIR